MKTTALTLALSALALGSPPLAAAEFAPTWASLESQYQTPDWFRDAKFGIWAHWGPQCEPEEGDWYARRMYVPGEKVYDRHLAEYGHPSQEGFKDIIHRWKAEHFDPDALLAFYKQCGARYFMALANHHDNFDNFNSKYQPWNSVNLGPHQDLIGRWAAAARKNGLRFGVSVHASRSWTWYEVAQGADKTGPFAGLKYDGRLTKADGKGLWWEGYDPQDLYAQNHPVGARPDPAYIQKFVNRTQQLIDDYRPDLVYFDDSVLPARKAGDAPGLDLVAHFYNQSIHWHGRNEAVVNTKRLDLNQRKGLVYDIERGKAEAILPQAWQTDTCLGQWHYNREIFERHLYKPAAVVVPMLVDIVSRNGNLMLSVPVRADGTIDSDEVEIVKGIGRWLAVNGEAIYATRPWRVYGEGPSTTETQEKGQLGGTTDVRSKPYTAEDIRFTQSADGRNLYAIALALPANRELTVKALPQGTPIEGVALLGAKGPLEWKQDESGLHVKLPAALPSEIATAVRIALR